MKLVSVIVFSLLVVGFAASLVNPQVWPPTMAIQFSNGREDINCPDAPPGAVIDSLYIIARHIDCWMQGFEFKVSYPPEIAFLEDELACEPDLWVPPFPTSATGISITCEYPVPCLPHCVVDKVRFIWMCQHCTSIDIPVVAIPFQPDGCLCVVSWPDNIVIDLIGLTSIICSSFPIEETSWGKIKSLYR